MNNEEKRFLFAARTRGLNLKNNFKQGKQEDLMCRLCRGHIEDQRSLLTSSALKSVHAPSKTEYCDQFSDRIDKLAVITKVLKAKYADFTTRVNRQQQSCSATSVVNIDIVVDIDDHVELD